ncbi:hypothetical protein CONCODRAFT_4860 [Conidiobolus coronatus NRRL 28638]|uniref:Uncharacterized protein n=1 Tax=Conidiobolus coronatus (strain ATCC 28846 / CBS 209.66 / NRRL 28638) TaxID=796925 RepID=A0A137PBL6_CONC2|nr:hypothetical protein CONCODRAFT_4860 [Conidiobolus coronatus NRRL 28638]|eukprot:KXN72321.1 hypothetical protein CONCODRAFT_4860 [Conidiobolus coronatus NRRL 28638]
MGIRADFNLLLHEDIMFRAFFETVIEREPTQEIVDNTADLKLREIYNQYYEELQELQVRERNSEFFDDIVNWNDPNPQIKNDKCEFRRELYSNIIDTVYSLDKSGLRYKNIVYDIYFAVREFKWYSKDYTIYANGRNKRKDEVGINFNQQLDIISHAVYHDVKQPDISSDSFSWNGCLVGNEVAVDISIRWEPSLIKPNRNAESAEDPRFKVIVNAFDYIKVFKIIKESFYRRSYIRQTDYSQLIDYYFSVENVIIFLNRYDNEDGMEIL